jgi:hypothetical protein
MKRPPEIGVVLPLAVTGSSIWGKDELKGQPPREPDAVVPHQKSVHGERALEPARADAVRAGGRKIGSSQSQKMRHFVNILRHMEKR